MTLGLLVADAFQFLFRGCLRHEIVHPGFGCDRRGGQRVIAGDHHRFDSHFAQLREALLDSAFDHILELDRAKRQHVGRDDERRASPVRNFVHCFRHRLWKYPARRFDKPADRVGRAFANARFRSRAVGVKIDTAHPRLRCERHEGGLQFVHITCTQSEFFFRQHDDRASFRRFIGQRTQLRRSREIIGRNAWRGMKPDSHAIAERDRAGFVQ